MRLKTSVFLTGLILLAGCASLSLPRAVVEDGTIRNPSLGFSGFTFQIPDGFKLYNPAEPAAEYTPLQQLAIRIYKLNEEWHPRGNELFYESFLLMSDQTCFLLITLKTDIAVRTDVSPFWEDVSEQWDVMPLYNITARRAFETGPNRQSAVYTAGSAHESKGWYYPGPRRNSTPFNYESCRIIGGNRDQYILTGFALPEQAAALSEPMQQMIGGLSFSAQ